MAILALGIVGVLCISHGMLIGNVEKLETRLDASEARLQTLLEKLEEGGK